MDDGFGEEDGLPLPELGNGNPLVLASGEGIRLMFKIVTDDADLTLILDELVAEGGVAHVAGRVSRPRSLIKSNSTATAVFLNSVGAMCPSDPGLLVVDRLRAATPQSGAK
jgi:hypothetical protein